jgi:SAM-dependent methyltransferase
MQAEYVQVYAELYQRHWWWRSREELVLEEIRRRRPAGGYGPILDIGCGSGLFFERLREFGEPEGVEGDALWREHGPPGPGTVHYRMFDESFDEGRRYGLILMLDIVEHVERDDELLGHAVNLLSEGGVLLVTVPAFRSAWTRHDDLNLHKTRYTRQTFLETARKAGMSVDKTRYFFQSLYFAKLATRAAEAVWPAEPAVPGIPGGGLNDLLIRGARLEQKVAGGLPFGSSLMAIGGKARG